MALLAMMAAWFAVSLARLEYREDVAEFLPDNEANERINIFYRHIGSSNRLMVFFSMKDTLAAFPKERAIEAVEDFVAHLAERDTAGMISSVTARQDAANAEEIMSFIRENAPYFLTDGDYVRMDSLLRKEGFAARQLREDKKALMLPAGAMMRDMLTVDPLGLFAPALLQLQGLEAGDGNELYDGYLFMNGGRKAVVILSTPFGASESKRNTELVNMVEGVIEDVAAEYPDMRITSFGTPAIAVSNASRIKADSLLSSGLAVVLILGLLIYFFRSWRNIALVFAPVLFGWLFAMAALSLAMDSVSIIVIGISSIVIGIAVNYPLHLVDHINHEGNVRRGLRDIIPPLLIGNITTVGAFLSLAFINSSAMRSLGLFGSLLLIGTILFTLIFLPHYVRVGNRAITRETRLLDRISSFSPETKPWILWTALALTFLFGWQSLYTRFEADANKINYLSPAQAEDMRDTYSSIEKEGKATVYVVAEGRSMDEALTVYEANGGLIDSLLAGGMVESVAGAGNLLASRAEQERRIGLWRDFWSNRRDALLKEIEITGREEGFRAGTFARFGELINADYEPMTEDYFAPLNRALEGSFILRHEDRVMVVTLLYCEKEETGRILQALESAAVGTFAFDSGGVISRMVDSLSGDFNYVLYVCGIIVFIFLLASFGRVELSLLAFVPLTVSWVWILGLMNIGGMSFNIVNIILASFIFGQGDDYTIFITEGLVYEYAYGRKMLRSYKNSIILSALIMFTGIGMLIVARHPALRSLAEVTMVGMFSVVLMAWLIPPLIFHALTKYRGAYRPTPVTMKKLGFSILAFCAFVAGSMIITLTAVFMPTGNNERWKLRYHVFLCRIMRWVMGHIPGVRTRYDNPEGETFERQAVIICNHQSHFDLGAILTLSPRLLVITNDWAWNNPFYGRLIKHADFYPASLGTEAIIEKLRDRVANGYSVVIFPEGTRSADCSILRFHRGAFHIAEQLGLDVLPILIHGAGHVLPKNDFMLNEGEIRLQVMPRIPAGTQVSAKEMRHYYIREYGKLASSIETAAYFAGFVIRNYIYKGIETEYHVRREVKKFNAYGKWIDNFQGTSGRALVLNSGYGVFAFLFALVHESISVVAVEADDDKVALARCCAGKPDNLFVHGTDYVAEEDDFDVIFILSPTPSQLDKYDGDSRCMFIGNG
jgi:1-acyl-sn-glycerol-3-phosphate acyltransferase